MYQSSEFCSLARRQFIDEAFVLNLAHVALELDEFVEGNVCHVGHSGSRLGVEWGPDDKKGPWPPPPAKPDPLVLIRRDPADARLIAAVLM
jgi:hypothetical protein